MDIGTFQTGTVQGVKKTALHEHFVFERPGNQI